MNNIVYSEKILEKEFSNKVSKEAYLSACKWLAKNVYSNKSLSEKVNVNITKTNSTTFLVTLYSSIDEQETANDFCSKCKSLHTIFYSIDKPECNKCNAFCYRREMSKVTNGIKTFVRELLEDK